MCIMSEHEQRVGTTERSCHEGELVRLLIGGRLSLSGRLKMFLNRREASCLD